MLDEGGKVIGAKLINAVDSADGQLPAGTAIDYEGVGTMSKSKNNGVDPQALVDSTSSVKQVLERNGWGAEGMVNRDADTVDCPEFDELPYQVADDIVDEHCANEVIENHGGRIKKKDYGALREKVKAKLKGGM